MRVTHRFLLVAAFAASVSGAGCARTWGAPEGPDGYDAESNAEAMEDEEAEDAWDDANR